uniref:Uncharacterized protein n=1 Tax=Rhizophora mucronata TaxID=61149 RepID=A0A2P2NZQ6_RHIMU
MFIYDLHSVCMLKLPCCLRRALFIPLPYLHSLYVP